MFRLALLADRRGWPAGHGFLWAAAVGSPTLRSLPGGERITWEGLLAVMADPCGSGTGLSGGRITEGVIRVGDTVRRPANSSSEFVAALLRLLEEKHFDGVPRYLGQIDGMDVLSHIGGDVPSRFRTWSDEQVAAAGVLLRSLHDATHGSALAGRFPVVCHHDAGPDNVVFRDAIP